MGDTMTVRDHSQPCEHDESAEGRYYSELGFWCCWSCPGGKEITLRYETVTIDGMNVKDVWMVEVGNDN